MFWKPKRPPRLWFFCDGSTGAREVEAGPTPNGAPPSAALPLECAAAAVARGADGQILDWAWQRLPNITNNEAEYAGLLLGLGLAQRLGAGEAICVLDSEVVVGQMEGRFAVRSPRLQHWHRQARALARELPAVHYLQISREWNRLADGLAAQASIPWPALMAELER